MCVRFCFYVFLLFVSQKNSNAWHLKEKVTVRDSRLLQAQCRLDV